MAADTRAYSGNRWPIGQKSKIERQPDGTLVGVSSNIVGGAETVRKWWADGCPADRELPTAFYLLAVKENGEVYYANDTHHVSGPLTADYFAIGSGNEIALGAMAHGAGAVEAVRAGCLHDPWSEPPINAIDDTGHAWSVSK